MPSSRTRICMLIPSYFPLLGGAEIQLSGLLDKLDGDRFEPFVLTRRIHGGRHAGLHRSDPVVHLPAPLCPSMFFFSALRYLWKHRRDYDVIHVHSFDSPALAGAVIKLLKPNKTLILRIPRFGPGSSYDRLSRTRTGRARLRFVLGRADAVIPLSAEAAGALEASGLSPEKIARIPNGVDVDYFRPADARAKRVLKRSFGVAQEAYVAIVVARLIPRKNVIGVVKAWKRVCDSHRGSVLVVVGDGPQAPRLTAYVDAEMDAGSVIFTGESSRDEVARLLRTADVFVSYSRSEGMSNAMLEAMSSGLPVVAARGPGIDQMVRHARTGFLFDADHPTDGADYLLRLAEDPELLASMSREVRRDVESHYAFEQIARRVERLYREGPRSAKDDLCIRPPTGAPATAPVSPKQAGPQPRRHRTSRRSRRQKRKKRANVGN